jgi:hypothetical protein
MIENFKQIVDENLKILPLFFTKININSATNPNLNEGNYISEKIISMNKYSPEDYYIRYLYKPISKIFN